MVCNGRTFEELHLTKIAIKEWAPGGGLLRSYPSGVKFSCQWAAMGCIGRTFDELFPDESFFVKVGCKGLQCKDF